MNWENGNESSLSSINYNLIKIQGRRTLPQQNQSRTGRVCLPRRNLNHVRAGSAYPDEIISIVYGQGPPAPYYKKLQP